MTSVLLFDIHHRISTIEDTQFTSEEDALRIYPYRLHKSAYMKVFADDLFEYTESATTDDTVVEDNQHRQFLEQIVADYVEGVAQAPYGD